MIIQNIFQSLYDLNNSLALKELSMGMSADYLDAIKFGSTFVRIGKLYIWFAIKTLVFLLIFFKILRR